MPRKASPNPKPTPKPPDDAEQSKRFEETARELEADESGKAFERAVGVVVKPPIKRAAKAAPSKPVSK